MGCHDQVRHIGRDRTLGLVHERFYWPGMTGEVVDHVTQCEVYQEQDSQYSESTIDERGNNSANGDGILDFLSLEPSKVILSLDFASCYTCVCLLHLAAGMCVKCFGLGL